MSLESDLKALNAPTKVREAGKALDDSLAIGLTPSRELAEYVQRWVNRNRGNDRYGN